MKKKRWKTNFFLNPKSTGADKETYGFKSPKSPAVISEFKKFEDSMIHLIQNIQFENRTSKFQYKYAKISKKLRTTTDSKGRQNKKLQQNGSRQIQRPSPRQRYEDLQKIRQE